MSFFSWLQNLRFAVASRRGRRQHRRRDSARTATHRLNLEVLEDRCLLSFSPAVIYPVGSNPQAVVAGDFNNDNVLDLAVSNGYVLLGNRDGTFAAPRSYGIGAFALAVGDFNGDGALDLVTLNYGGVSVLPGNGNGTFGTPNNIAITGSSPSSVAVGDFNGDGLLDLGVTSNTFYPASGFYTYDQHYEGFANVLLGDGAGGFFPESDTIDLGGGYRTAATAVDFNGIDRFATVNSDLATVGLVWGGDFSTGYYNDPTSVAAGDVNGDNAADLITGNNDGTISVLLGDGLGGFGSFHSYAAGSWGKSVAVGDFNHDNILDIVTSGNQYETGHVEVLLGHGDGTFAIPIDRSLNLGNASGLAIGDFNGDGLPDVAAGTTGNLGAGNVSVLINDGSWSAPGPPSVRLNDLTVTEGNTGTVNATFTLTLSAASTVNVTVHYGRADITAMADSDYTAASGTVTILAGQLSRTFTVVVLGDRVPEPTETFAVNLSAATNATIGDGQGIGTILDNEPRISIRNVTKKEGSSGATAFIFTVSLSAAYDQTVTVNFSTSNGTATAGSDYTARSGTLTFAPGQTTATITVYVSGDGTAESDETFYVNLSNPSSNALIANPLGIGTILNDDSSGSGGGKHR
jgi:hypothetical protein